MVEKWRVLVFSKDTLFSFLGFKQGPLEFKTREDAKEWVDSLTFFKFVESLEDLNEGCYTLVKDSWTRAVGPGKPFLNG